MADLSAIGAKTSGTVEELSKRLATYKRTPGLYDAMRHENRKLKRKRVFGRELQGLPDNSFEWKNGSYPTFSLSQIRQYTSGKLPGTQSLLQKGRAFFNSRKVVTIKVSEEEDKNVLWVRAFVERSFGTEQRPVYVKFVELKPVGGFCGCRIGKSGLCAHVIAVLYNLKHRTEHGEFLLPLTSTSKKQKWHKKGYVRQKVFTPINKYRVRSAVRESSVKNNKRDIAGVVDDIKKQVDSSEVELHFLRTIGMSDSSRMRNGGLYPLLAHKYIHTVAPNDHDYFATTKPVNSGASVDDHMYTTPKDTTVPGPSTSTTVLVPSDSAQYFDVKQDSEEWQQIRKNRVTASKAGDLIGLGGKSKFLMGWKAIEGECNEESLKFQNFQRGISYESVARDKFNRESGIGCFFYCFGLVYLLLSWFLCIVHQHPNYQTKTD